MTRPAPVAFCARGRTRDVRRLQLRAQVDVRARAVEHDAIPPGTVYVYRPEEPVAWDRQPIIPAAEFGRPARGWTDYDFYLSLRAQIVNPRLVLRGLTW